MSERRSKATYFKLAAVASVASFVGVLAALAAWQFVTEYRQSSAKAEGERFTIEQKRLPLGRQQEAIKRSLFDPTAAVFRIEHVSTNKSNYWCGEVNGRNRMGAMVGFRRYVVELQADPELAEFDDVHVDPQSSDPTSESVRFAAYWNGYCQ